MLASQLSNGSYAYTTLTFAATLSMRRHVESLAISYAYAHHSATKVHQYRCGVANELGMWAFLYRPP